MVVMVDIVIVAVEQVQDIGGHLPRLVYAVSRTQIYN